MSGTDPNRQMWLTMGVIALVLLALGVGFLVGERLGGDGGRAPGAAAPGTHVGGVPLAPGQPCPFAMAAEDAWVLAGMICNCDDGTCNGTPLLDCHCDTAHSMKTLTKELLAQGLGRDEIGAALEERWGTGIVPVLESN